MIHGKIVDTQGKPVAGVQVAVTVVGAFDGNSVDRFLSAWTNRMFSFQWPEADRNLWQEGGAIAAATTDADGRFRLAGTGAERLVHLRTSGAGSAAADWRVVNRPGFNATPYNETVRKQSPIIVSGSRSSAAPVLHGPEPVFVVEPGKVIRGVVRDAGTGKPWPGVEVHCNGQLRDNRRGRPLRDSRGPQRQVLLALGQRRPLGRPARPTGQGPRHR